MAPPPPATTKKGQGGGTTPHRKGKGMVKTVITHSVRVNPRPCTKGRAGRLVSHAQSPPPQQIPLTLTRSLHSIEHRVFGGFDWGGDVVVWCCHIRVPHHIYNSLPSLSSRFWGRVGGVLCGVSVGRRGRIRRVYIEGGGDGACGWNEGEGGVLSFLSIKIIIVAVYFC